MLLGECFLAAGSLWINPLGPRRERTISALQLLQTEMSL